MKHIARWWLAIGLAITTLPPPARAQNVPYLVKDINTAPAGSALGELTEVNGTLFFAAMDPTHGDELWRSDGTPAGTVVVKDIYPGTGSSGPHYLTNVGGTLLFNANNGGDGLPALWRSDGTAAGTVLVRNIWAQNLTNVDGRLFFRDGETDGDLWWSDGTSAGTILLRQIDSHIAGLTNVNGILAFVASPNQLWRSDGTAAGTVLVTKIDRDVATNIFEEGSITSVNGTLFFASDYDLWRSDGTAAGTVLLKEINQTVGDARIRNFTNVNGTLFFMAYDRTRGTELWRSDGTAAGTVLVKNVSWPEELTNVNGTLFFATLGGDTGGDLWRSDGTPAGTAVVKYDCDPSRLTNVRGVLYFNAFDPTNGYELWKTDGTDAGTVLVKDINPGPNGSDPGQYAQQGFPDVNGTIFFGAYDPTSGRELWRSDGTAAGTVRVKDINTATESSFPGSLTDVNGRLFFVVSFLAYDGRTVDTQLWRSDGTAAGTVPVSGSYASYGFAHMLTAVDGTLFFATYGTQAHPAGSLWASDGTAPGTVLVTEVGASELTNVNGTLFFKSSDTTHGQELWRSDGVAAGTGLVKDILPGSVGSFCPAFAICDSGFTKVGETLFFVASDGMTGRELWRSNGTAAGTVRVKDINPSGDAFPCEPPSVPSSPSCRANLTVVNGTLMFIASDGTTGQALWRSDGTSAGTVLVKDINPASSDSEDWWQRSAELTNVNGRLFFVADSATTGRELWWSDGTTAGTVLVRDIEAGSESAAPAELTNVSGTLFFVADDGTTGRELWRSDGTAAGTVLVKDIVAGASSSYPTELINLNGRLFFATDDPNIPGNRKLWRSDGTANGTVMVQGLDPNAAPYALTNVGGRLFFGAFAPFDGTELWSLGPSTSPTPTPTATPTPIARCVGDCGSDGAVTIDDLIRAVNIALNNLPVSDCRAADRNRDGRVSIDELIAGVNAARGGCAA